MNVGRHDMQGTLMRVASDTRSSFRRSLGLAAAVTLSACGARGEPAPEADLLLVPGAQTGGEAEAPATHFTSVRQVVATDSEAFVLPAEVPEIRVFDARAKYARTIGRRGAGPGEFDAVAAMGVHGDTLWTIDTNLRRVSRFTLGGTLLGSTRFSPVPPTLGTGGGPQYFPFPMAVLADGSLLGTGGTSGRAIDLGQVTGTPLVHWAVDGGHADTLGWVPFGHEHMILHSGRGTMYRSQPFSDAPLVAFSPAGAAVYVVERYAATADGRGVVRVVKLAASGDTVWRRELPYTPRALDVRAADSLRADLERKLAPGFAASEIQRALFVPAYATPITHALAGADDRLWLEWEASREATRYSVLSADGREEMRVRAPARTRLRWAGAEVAWGQVLDQDDVPTLVKYAIRPLGAR